MRARHYCPETGRFLSCDPLGMIDSANLYQGFNGNPTNFIDPMGQNFTRIIDFTTPSGYKGNSYVNSEEYVKGGYLDARFRIYKESFEIWGINKDWDIVRLNNPDYIEFSFTQEEGEELLSFIRREQGCSVSILGNFFRTIYGVDPDDVQLPTVELRDKSAKRALPQMLMSLLSTYYMMAEASMAKNLKTVYNVRTSSSITKNVLNKIDKMRLNPEARFGRAVYLAEQDATAAAEVAYHGGNPTHAIKYNLNLSEAKILDLSDLKIASQWGYYKTNNYNITKFVAAKARLAGYNVIKFHSLRGDGINYAVLDNFEKLLIPKMVVPIK
jgi:hypothetical protein